ncbi:MAG TPA: amidase [Burkholderiales bacterium]|nr:amidase [Burkholderiales bacterium]
MTTQDLCFTGAAKLARLIRTRKVSASEVMRAFIAQVERVNPHVNAIVTFLPEPALKAARALDRRLGKRSAAPLGSLAGLPIAYKDLVATKGIRTTLGSKIYASHVPKENALLVDRLQAAGAITLGKTNTPEFGAGSQTFNAVFGATRNPYDPSKTCGGSSGGGAVAAACGMLPFADGSDLAASLRNPGNYCNVVGLRPTPGRVPGWPAADSWDSLAVIGPMARTVGDAAFLLSAMAGPDLRAPLSISEPGRMFARPLGREFRGTRIAWTRDFGGLPIDPRVSAVLDAQRRTFTSLGCKVEEACPDFDGAKESFETLRAVAFAQKYASLLKTHRAELKDTVIWNIEQGLALEGAAIARAVALRSELFQRMRSFLQRYDFLVGPVNQLPPFPVDLDYPREIAGVAMGNYLDWMKSCYYVTITSHPAISVPAGFTTEGLPVGIQIVGRYRNDFSVLQLAHAFEEASGGAWQRRPPITA